MIRISLTLIFLLIGDYASAQLRLIKTSFIDNQGQLVQGGIVQGTVPLNKPLVWAALKLPTGLIRGHVFQTAEQTWHLDVPLTPQQFALFEQSLKSHFYVLAVSGDYQTLEAAPFEVTFSPTILATLKTVNTIEQLQQSVTELMAQGAIQTFVPLTDMAAIVFTLRRQFFEYYQTEGAIRLRYKAPRLFKQTKTLIHSPVYVEQVHLFPVEVVQQSTQEWTNDGYRIQTVRFFIAVDLVKAIALQSEMVDSKGYRQASQVVIIQEPYKLYTQKFTLFEDFKQYRLFYWGKIFLKDGSVVALPKTRIHFSVPVHTQELSHILEKINDEQN
ncbi:hypothetical protein THIOM_005214 [Candidatus Thiomargarita nelsonii]|uniref:Uncharacterized protein n=1 Tax=Candidatus Thiomargarita nelsonii TaxID=1003181 RepID=A0A176RTV6_9GAMM|nr:hypothetical protein THIOM_005214 [Candidatus Thiomargarita nelsonii]